MESLFIICEIILGFLFKKLLVGGNIIDIQWIIFVIFISISHTLIETIIPENDNIIKKNNKNIKKNNKNKKINKKPIDIHHIKKKHEAMSLKKIIKFILKNVSAVATQTMIYK